MFLVEINILGIETCDLLVINKIDIASYIGADLGIMERDAKLIRGDKPFVFVNSKTGQGIKEATNYIIRDLLFNASTNLK
jgi:urease accessory protein